MEVLPQPESPLERLMAQYGDSLLRTCWMMLNDRDLARDAAQETFLKAYRALPTLREGKTEKAWLMQIAVNVCRDMRRGFWFRRIDRRLTPDDLPETAREDERPDPAPFLAVMSLPAKDRETVVLHYYQGLSLAEIAKLTEVPASTVRARLARAKKKLHRKLEGWYYDE